MPPSMEEDRRREADRLRDELPLRPLTRRDFVVLQADPDYDVYWVRGHYDESDTQVATQFAVRFNQFHIFALDYSANTGHWDAIATGDWPADIPTIDREFNRVASPTADWHTPLANYLD